MPLDGIGERGIPSDAGGPIATWKGGSEASHSAGAGPGPVSLPRGLSPASEEDRELPFVHCGLAEIWRALVQNKGPRKGESDLFLAEGKHFEWTREIEWTLQA
jgi:hypothetical protein